jgi:hypothetical protein
MILEESIVLKQAIVRYGNLRKYFSLTLGYDCVQAINYYPKLGTVEVIKTTGAVNYYQDFNGLFGGQ